LRFLFYLDLYSIGLAFAGLLLVGVIRLWGVPAAAAREDLQPFDLLARALEDRRAAWLIWEPVGRDLELPCRSTPDLLESAYPDEADRAAALEWANDFYRRLAVLERLITYKRGWMEINGDLSDLPPASQGRLQELLDWCVGLTPESARAARQRWLGYSPGRAELALGWGRELERQRRRAGEPLPPSSDNIALLCVLERLTGLDAYGARCRQFLSAELGVGRRGLEESGPAVPLFYPSDDYFFLTATADPLRLGWPSWGTLLGTLAFLLAASVGLRLLVFVLLGRVALRLQDDPHFVEYQRHRTRWTAGDLFAGYLLIPLLAWPLAWGTLPVQLQVLTRSPWQVLGGVFASVLLGGTLLLVVSQVVALLLIARGYDLQATWWDEILGLGLGAAILFHFGNDSVSIASYVAFALLPEVLARRRVRRFREERRLAEEERTTALTSARNATREEDEGVVAVPEGGPSSLVPRPPG
jgi:hypothetical protein